MFIRTQDGIYEIIDETENGYWSIYGDYFKKNIEIKQANTIEELCDCFLLVRTNKKSFPIDFKQLWRAKKVQKELKIETILKGAIWTSKGLIYVAKMNDKGKLELI